MPPLHAVLARRWISTVAFVFGATLGATWGLGVAFAEDPPTSREDARRLEAPIPYTPETVGEGRKLYLRLCQNCHGKDGRALESFDFEATDLTQPDRYRHGATDGDIYWSIKEGAGNDMPPFKEKLEERQVWELVWFVRSLGPESARPKAQTGASQGEAP